MFPSEYCLLTYVQVHRSLPWMCQVYWWACQSHALSLLLWGGYISFQHALCHLLIVSISLLKWPIYSRMSSSLSTGACNILIIVILNPLSVCFVSQQRIIFPFHFICLITFHWNVHTLCRVAETKVDSIYVWKSACLFLCLAFDEELCCALVLLVAVITFNAPPASVSSVSPCG